MNLKHKLFALFDIYVPSDQTDEDTIKDINRRGKIDKVKLTEAIFLLAKEIEKLQLKEKEVV